MSSPRKLTPSRLRLLLSVMLPLIILAGGGIFYVAYSRLGESAAETGQRAANARESQDTLRRLQSLRKDLDSKKEIADRASRVAANSQNYAYQDLLVNDLTIYANRANLSVKNINFSNQTPGASSSASTPSTPSATVGGLKKATVDITLENPVNYQDLLNFLHYVEQNLTKLKISKVVMTKKDSNGVTIDVLNLEVYLR